MNGLVTELVLVDVSASVLEFAINWLLQSTLLIGCGLVLGELLKRSGSAVQSVLYRTTLLAVLVCPLATWVLSQAGVSGWSLAIPDNWFVLEGKSRGLETLSVAPEPWLVDTTSTYENDYLGTLQFQRNQAVDTDLDVKDPARIVFVQPGMLTVAGGVSIGPPSSSSGVDTIQSRPSLLGYAGIAIVGCWLVVSIYLAARLVNAFRRLCGLRRGAAIAEESTLEACRKLSATLDVTPPEVLRSPLLPSPCLAGLRRPAVLLPETDLELSLREVLIHELAHLRRYDCHWNLLRQVTTSLYFFQPLLWVLSRRIEATAEEVCDDYVVHLGGDRQEYAHQLVDIAELSAIPASAAGVGIVSMRSTLANRVRRILDTSRALSTRVGKLLIAVALVGGLFATTITGLLGLSPRPVLAEGVLEVLEAAVSNGELDSKSKETTADTDKSNTTQGRVVDPDGNPVSGATVFAAWTFVGNDSQHARSLSSQRSEHLIIAETVSDSAGAFELNFSLEQPDKSRLARGFHIVAIAEGYGPAWMHSHQLATDRAPTLLLARNENVRGRILDIAGKPIPGVQVSIHSLRPASSQQAIADWIEEARRKVPPKSLDEYHSAYASGAYARYPAAFPHDWNDGGLVQGSPALPSVVETDESGHFEFRGLGADRLARIQIEGSSISKTYLQVVTRKMDPLSAMPLELVGMRSDVYYGREFEFVAAPTQPVVGAITDVDTGEPIADAEVRLAQFADDFGAQDDFLSARTDENGKYRLLGLPQGGGHRLEITPNPAQPYFPDEKTLPKVSDSSEPITCDFALKRGKWIIGKVTDSASGKPVSEVMVEYLPLRSSVHATEYSYFRSEITGSVPSDRYRTDQEGNFRVLAIPGFGVLVAIAKGKDQEEFSKLAVDQVSDSLIGESPYPYLNTYHPWNITDYNALVEVELSEDYQDATYDLTLTRGGTKLLKFVDDRGQPVTGVRVLGRRATPNLDEPTKEPHVKLIGMRSDERRIVGLVHPERRIGKVLTVSADGEQTVTLEPCGIARGRFVDEDGRSVSKVEVNVTIDESDNWHRPLVVSKTDENGWFEALLPPGWQYRVWHYEMDGPSFSAEFKPRSGEEYELGELKDGVKLAVDEAKSLKRN